MSLSHYTVGDLRHALEQYPDNTVVVLSSDNDGGDKFSTLADITAGRYIDEDGYTGDFISNEDLDEDLDGNINIDDSTVAISLWPSG